MSSSEIDEKGTGSDQFSLLILESTNPLSAFNPILAIIGLRPYLSYNVSKAGVIELTKTLTLELSPTIRVNAICPGYVVTPMQEKEYTPEELNKLANTIPIKRLGKTKEIAALVAYLISEDAQFINGSSIVIDGGETAGGLASA